VSDYNQRVIEEFRANGGVVGGGFERLPLLLLTTTGARSGRLRTTPLAYLEDAGRLVVFASAGGAPRNPGWYHNLRADPIATVELGVEQFEVRAIMAEGAERERLFAAQAARRPQFAEYQAKTSRTIPVVVLERVSRGSANRLEMEPPSEPPTV
jgi:deazaflavin-dependent oxidoreductase (nitroreductase family)